MQSVPKGFIFYAVFSVISDFNHWLSFQQGCTKALLSSHLVGKQPIALHVHYINMNLWFTTSNFKKIWLSGVKRWSVSQSPKSDLGWSYIIIIVLGSQLCWYLQAILSLFPMSLWVCSMVHSSPWLRSGYTLCPGPFSSVINFMTLWIFESGVKNVKKNPLIPFIYSKGIPIYLLFSLAHYYSVRSFECRCFVKMTT